MGLDMKEAFLNGLSAEACSVVLWPNLTGCEKSEFSVPSFAEPWKNGKVPEALDYAHKFEGKAGKDKQPE